MSQEPQRSAPVPVIVHLSGSRRGTTQRLRGDELRIGTGPDVEIHVAHEPAVASHHATLRRHANTYRLEGDATKPVWVNGKPAEEEDLSSGDVLEIGRDGPLLRYRLYPPGSRAYKTPMEAFSDCVECARHSSETPVGRAAALLTGTSRELATQTSIWFRGLTIMAMAAVATLVILLARDYSRLEDRLQQEEQRVAGISEFLEAADQELSPEDVEAVRRELSTTLERVEALEARTDAPTRIVAEASASVVFLQGSYGFIEPSSQKPLRFAGTGPDGMPLRTPDGAPIVGLEGNGPVVEAMFTGTAFVATADGLLLTNRHVALPWAYDQAAKMVSSQGFIPVMTKFIGYLPKSAEPFDVRLVLASDNADLAILSCTEVTGLAPTLAMGDQQPEAGDEIIVLGYPTGIRALLARADEAFVNDLAAGNEMDFWTIARRLAAAGHIAPLASRGIVAQVTPGIVVYDAETTRGGSGGPVLGFDGKVVAVTSAIVPEFGGSNLGVRSSRVRALLFLATLNRILPFYIS